MCLIGVKNRFFDFSVSHKIFKFFKLPVILMNLWFFFRWSAHYSLWINTNNLLVSFFQESHFHNILILWWVEVNFALFNFFFFFSLQHIGMVIWTVTHLAFKDSYFAFDIWFGSFVVLRIRKTLIGNWAHWFKEFMIHFALLLIEFVK